MPISGMPGCCCGGWSPIARRGSLGLPWGLQWRVRVLRGAPPAQAVIHVSHKPPVTSRLVVFLPVQYRSGAANSESSGSLLHSPIGVQKKFFFYFTFFYLFLGNGKTIFIREKIVSMTITVSARARAVSLGSEVQPIALFGLLFFFPQIHCTSFVIF